MYFFDEKRKQPLHIQLYEAIKEDILTNRQKGDKLPSIRKTATLHNLSKTTVESAYTQLCAEGYVESVPKRGYFISDLSFTQFTPPTRNRRPQSTLPEAIPWRYDFFPARLRSEDFPLKLWKRLFARVIDETIDFGSYPDGAGEMGLREQIAAYLAKSRGVVCRAEQVIVCSGFADAMSLLAKLVKRRYDTFGMEHPGYHVAHKVFADYGYNIRKIPVGKQGLDLQALETSGAQIVYITPSHQYPTGVAMPVANRQKLLAYIKRIEGLIIEDDYDSELTYKTRPIPSLQGLDRNNRIVYMGTFAKSLSPALRVAYMILPEHLLPDYYESFDAHFPHVSITTQKTLEHFMKEGHWERHLRKIRTLYRKKHDLMKKALRKRLGKTFTIVAEGGGLAILIYPTRPFNWQKCKTLAEKKRIKLYFAKERSGGGFEALRMGFGGFSEAEIYEAVEAFGEVWDACLR